MLFWQVKQDTQCMYNITFWQNHIRTVAMDMQHYIPLIPLHHCHKCSHQQYKSVWCCHGNATNGSLSLPSSYRILRTAVQITSIKYQKLVSVILPQLASMQIVYFLHCITQLSAACLALPYSSTLCHKQHSLKKSLLKIKGVLTLSTFICNNLHSKNNSARNYPKFTQVFM